MNVSRRFFFDTEQSGSQLPTISGKTTDKKGGSQYIPIVDAQMIALKTAEMAVDLRRGLGLPFTSLPRPAREDVARVRSIFGLPN